MVFLRLRTGLFRLWAHKSVEVTIQQLLDSKQISCEKNVSSHLHQNCRGDQTIPSNRIPTFNLRAVSRLFGRSPSGKLSTFLEVRSLPVDNQLENVVRRSVELLVVLMSQKLEDAMAAGYETDAIC